VRTSIWLKEANKSSLVFQLFLLYGAFHMGFQQSGWLYTLGAVSLISLWSWYAALHIYRTTTGMPTSRIVSAAQGYVEVQGRGHFNSEQPLFSKLSAMPCLWYRYEIEIYEHDKWKHVEEGESTELFLLTDETGDCLVNPAGANILTRHKATWSESPLLSQRSSRTAQAMENMLGAVGNQHLEWWVQWSSKLDASKQYRYTEWRLNPQDEIYVLGEFKTTGGSSMARTLNDEIKNVLAEWKEDMPDLKRRFDLDGDGTFSMQEWQLARSAARREAEKNLNVARTAPDVHCLAQPHDKRLFLISNLDQATLDRNYILWAWLHMIIFVLVLGGMAWLLNHPV
jgi:hypothetical protein